MCWWVQSALNLNHNAFLGNSWSTWASLKILQHIIYAYKQSFLGHIMNLIKNSKNIHARGWIEAAYIFTLRKTHLPMKVWQVLKKYDLSWLLQLMLNKVAWDQMNVYQTLRKITRFGWSTFSDNHCSVRKDRMWYFLW